MKYVVSLFFFTEYCVKANRFQIGSKSCFPKVHCSLRDCIWNDRKFPELSGAYPKHLRPSCLSLLITYISASPVVWKWCEGALSCWHFYPLYSFHCTYVSGKCQLYTTAAHKPSQQNKGKPLSLGCSRKGRQLLHEPEGSKSQHDWHLVTWSCCMCFSGSGWRTYPV